MHITNSHRAPSHLDAQIAELGAKLRLPSEWTGLRDAVVFLRSARVGRHTSPDFGLVRNAKAMRDYYLGAN